MSPALSIILNDGWISAIASSLSALIALGALIAVYFEYERQKKLKRLELAQEMMEKLDSDELLNFAVTRLDWGAGLVIIPPSWQKAIPEGSVRLDLAVLKKALRPKLLAAVAGDPVALLYRHSFVHLFDHLDRVSALVSGGSIELADLRAHGWVAHQLAAWPYIPAGEQAGFFLDALRAWYPQSGSGRLIDQLCQTFPPPTAEKEMPD